MGFEPESRWDSQTTKPKPRNANPNAKMSSLARNRGRTTPFGLRISGFFRHSAFGFRISSFIRDNLVTFRLPKNAGYDLMWHHQVIKLLNRGHRWNAYLPLFCPGEAVFCGGVPIPEPVCERGPGRVKRRVARRKTGRPDPVRTGFSGGSPENNKNGSQALK